MRCISPGKVGAKIRASGVLTDVAVPAQGTAQATVTVTIASEGSDKPAAVVESIVRYIS